MVERSNDRAAPAFARLLALLLALCWGSCQGTETGNPPFASEGAFRVMAVSAEWVEVVADPGSVWPGGSEVVIVNAESLGRTTVRAGADGSLRARVPGSIGDGFTVTVRDGTRESDPVQVLPAPPAVIVPSDASAPMMAPADASAPAPTAPTPSEPPPTLPTGPVIIDVDRADAGALTSGLGESGATASACEALRAQATTAQRAALESAGRACSVDVDCADVTEATLTVCTLRCEVVIAPAASSAALAAASERIQTEYCQPYLSQGCPIFDLGSCPPASIAPRCVDSLCVNAPRGTLP